ncbi:MAG TPA: DUF2844 domain-containing protein [Steroidobacteraceae bacterium]|jgi:hypothetical protein|nr:DUF2844 domain-containing protein [Steroidobacteraceae bacterium]
MKGRPKRGFYLPLLIGVHLFCADEACATLGQDAASVQSDAAVLHGSLQSNAMTQYVVHDIDGATGLRVREYLNAEGRVFAVTWKGAAMPDLQQLLGSNYAAFSRSFAATAHPGLRRAARFVMPGLVVEFGGHLRAYVGRAYLPAAMPTGMTAADLQ